MKGYCIILKRKYEDGFTKINGFKSIPDAKSMLYQEFFEELKDEKYMSSFVHFCMSPNEITTFHEFELSIPFIAIRDSVWEASEHELNEYSG